MPLIVRSFLLKVYIENNNLLIVSCTKKSKLLGHMYIAENFFTVNLVSHSIQQKKLKGNSTVRKQCSYLSRFQVLFDFVVSKF